MRMVKPVQVLWTLALAVVVLLPLAGVAFGSVTDISTERSGSIIVFPKVVWDGTRYDHSDRKHQQQHGAGPLFLRERG